MQRLGIVIPYRNRSDHLVQIVPHLGKYFTRHANDRNIPVRILVVEQPAGEPFNRGLMCNIGFQVLADEVDYVCFHDVDYLPIWADFTYPDQPTMLIWYGFESRPIDPARPMERVIHNLEASFSAAVLFRNEHFRRINGYPTAHWGWGYEDTDVQHRLGLAGYKTEHRKGTFAALDHRNEGYFAVKQPTPAHTRNLALLNSRWSTGGEPKYDWRQEGVSQTRFAITGRWRLTLPPETRSDISAERIVVGFDHKPAKLAQAAPAVLMPANLGRDS